MDSQIKFKLVRVIDIQTLGVFEWMGRLYTVTQPYDGEHCWATDFAGGWTNNPDNRWQYNVGAEQPFNPYCEVQEFKYVP